MKHYKCDCSQAAAQPVSTILLADFPGYVEVEVLPGGGGRLGGAAALGF